MQINYNVNWNYYYSLFKDDILKKHRMLIKQKTNLEDAPYLVDQSAHSFFTTLHFVVTFQNDNRSLNIPYAKTIYIL
jgi:hypothetical protein